MTENKQNNFVLRNSRLSNNNKILSKPVSAGNDKHLIWVTTSSDYLALSSRENLSGRWR